MSDATLDDDIPEFRGEYEQELVRWFRRRFGWMCGTYAILQAVFFAALLLRGLLGDVGASRPIGVVPVPAPDVAVDVAGAPAVTIGLPLESDSSGGAGSEARAGSLVDGIAGGLGLLAIAYFALRVRPRIENRAGALDAATRLLLLLGAIVLLGELVKRAADPAMVVSPLGQLTLLHLFACLFLPWTPRESVKPILPLIAVWAVYRITTGVIDGFANSGGVEAPVFAFVEVTLSPLVLLPGMGLCWWRMARYRRRFGREFTGRKLRALRREIKQARTIHDSLFPETFETEDPIRFDFAYAPASDLGGDFLHVQRFEDGSVAMVLLDVTGHGLSAAMTVNRLVGEIERLHAEQPGVGPGELLAGLDRYVHLTLARHSLLATAAAVLIQPERGEVRIANAGHPPVLRRRADGRIDRYAATEPLLGALPPGEFGTEEHRFELEFGDILFVYTDGAFEARDRSGRELGLDGFVGLCGGETPTGRWAKHLLRIVEGFEGPVRSDDVLVATLAWTGARVPRPSTTPRPRREETCA